MPRDAAAAIWVRLPRSRYRLDQLAGRFSRRCRLGNLPLRYCPLPRRGVVELRRSDLEALVSEELIDRPAWQFPIEIEHFE